MSLPPPQTGPDDMRLFPEIVAYRGREQPRRPAYRFFSGRSAPQALTFGELWLNASQLARQFGERGWQGERVLLVCRNERNFVVAFYACLLAGAIAVPTAPPRRQLLESRLRLLVEDARACAIVCDFDELTQTGFSVAASGLDVIDIRLMPEPEADFVFEPAVVGESDVAFLQYTSGSTGDPKGVVVSHSNLIHNSESIRISMGMSEASSVLVGLPLFHDMGLVGGVLQSMYVGCEANFIPPAELVQYPERWLELISTLQITTSGGPNFMYDLAAAEIRDEHIRALDLSSWQVAFCGAEPIRASTIARFTERFAASGFRAGAFYPCYGMAEATLFIAGNRVGEVPTVARRDCVEVVCCGEPAAGTQLRIVDPHSGRAVVDGTIGEVWISGGGVAQGYWMRESQSRQVFQARMTGESATAYLRTGDLGWMDAGRLYVTGRLKDLIILNGRNYAPQDIEETAEAACEAVRQSGVAAFSVSAEGGADRVVVVAELERVWMRRESEWPSLATAIRAAIHSVHGLASAEVLFIKPGALPRTSSGKVRRSQCRADYLRGLFRPDPANMPA